MSESMAAGGRNFGRLGLRRLALDRLTAAARLRASGIPGLDPEREREMQHRNLRETLTIVGGLGLLLAFAATLAWSWIGIPVAIAAVGAILLATPYIPPEAVMRMYRAVPLDTRHGSQILGIVGALSERAQLPQPPEVHVVPSATLNAFAVGRPGHAAIAVTEGILRKLSTRELAGVLAHEISHIRNDDLRIMALADIMTRVLQVLSWAAIGLLVYNIPAIVTGSARVPWLLIGVLYLAPTAGSLLQLALSRTREFDADLDGAVLTGDPVGLASALSRVERYQGRLWEDIAAPGGRRIPAPSVLRSHPETEERVARLRALSPEQMLPPLDIREEPMVSLVGFGPVAMRPRFRLPGLWF
jgi:heat shock protein HtpX